MSILESDVVAGDTDTGQPDRRGELVLAPDAVEVRRNAGLAALIGGLASAVAIAYLARASATGAVLDWMLAATLGLLGIGYLASLVDARTPLLVADTQGVRLRLGRHWRGLPWGALSRVEHTPRRGVLRDGRLVMVVHHPARLVEELDGAARRQSRLSQRLYGAPLAVPLGLSTKVRGAGDDLTAALATLAGGSSRVVEVAADSVEEDAAEATGETTAPRFPDPRPRIARALEKVAALLPRRQVRGGPDTEDEDAGPGLVTPPEAQPDAATPVEEAPVSATPSPLREHTPAARAEVHHEVEAEVEDLDGRELRRPGSVSLVEDTVVWGDRVSPIARVGHSIEPLELDDHPVSPAADPVIGPELAAARTRIGLTVDQLADRTRIRPHVIESIEGDDFVPCGGDFYARGHLRTLARVLGVDVGPLLTAYDDRYADAPISPRRVFEAELASGANGSIRGTRGGPNWSVLVAAVMALVLVWSVARLVMDPPVEPRGALPVLNGSAGVDNGDRRGVAPQVPVTLTAEGGGAHVIMRDGAGRIVFDGNVAFGETRDFQVSPPVRIRTSDGSLMVNVDGEDRGALGTVGEAAEATFTVTE